MANQAPDRRKVLEMMAKAAGASQFPGFSRWVFAGEHQHSSSTHVEPKPATYRPQFFTADEYQTIDTLTELIIPKDETPGAREAGVSEFIDFMAAHGEVELQMPMRAGLRWLETRAQDTHGVAFSRLAPGQQEGLLREAAYQNREGQQDMTGRKFFELMRRYTVMGYYTSRVGLDELDYPSLRFYTQSPACPHKDDPEHKHLPAARF